MAQRKNDLTAHSLLVARKSCRWTQYNINITFNQESDCNVSYPRLRFFSVSSIIIIHPVWPEVSKLCKMDLLLKQLSFSIFSLCFKLFSVHPVNDNRCQDSTITASVQSSDFILPRELLWLFCLNQTSSGTAKQNETLRDLIDDVSTSQISTMFSHDVFPHFERRARVHTVYIQRRRYAKVLKVFAKVLCYS